MHTLPVPKLSLASSVSSPTSAASSASPLVHPRSLRGNSGRTNEDNSLMALLPLLEQKAGRTTARYHDFQLASAFQPIVSVSHGRVVGYEALMRGTTMSGDVVSPIDVLNYAYRVDEMMHADRLSRLVHFSNFQAADPRDCWLYVNMHPHVFGMEWEEDQFITELPKHYGIPPDRIVLELLEQFILDEKRLTETVAFYRAQGFMIAIDDFGSGHSNFNRVWDVRPDIVKLDRGLVRRSVTDLRVQRGLRHMVRMLHESGAIVLAEGVETLEEALLLIEADADLLQGYWLGRPECNFPCAPAPIKEKVQRMWQSFSGIPQQKEINLDRATRPYRAVMTQIARQLSSGVDAGTAAAHFFTTPGAYRFYVLDEHGYQRDASFLAQDIEVDLTARLNPLRQDEQANWARRAYFWRALSHRGELKVTGPYFSLADGKDCYTVSIAIECKRETVVLCGDFFLDAS